MKSRIISRRRTRRPNAIRVIRRRIRTDTPIDPNLITYVSPLWDYDGFGEAARGSALSMLTTTNNIIFQPCGGNDIPGIETTPMYQELNPHVNYNLTGKIRISHWQPSFFSLYKHPGCYNIGMTVWEPDRLPIEWTKLCNTMDEIWVPSQGNIDAFKYSGVTVPIYKFPHAYIPSTERKHLHELDLYKDYTIFFSVFAWQDRKNPEGLIRAYKLAFSGREDVVLILKVNWTSSVDVVKHINRIFGSIAGKNPKIAVIDRRLSVGEMNDLYERGDIFVLPHRSEGWGLPMHHSMAIGKQVVATKYCGTAEFMDEDNSYPITEYKLGPVTQSAAFYNNSMQWAYPDEGQTIELLRRALSDFESKNDNYKKICKNSRKVGEKFSIENVGKIFERRICQIKQNLGLK